MKHIIIFSGTTEGRKLSEKLAKAQIPHMVSVATDYGELVMTESPLVTIQNGRLSQEEMYRLLLEADIQIVVDATHPYATVVTKTILDCVASLKKQNRDIIYLRLEREIKTEGNKHVFESDEACIAALEKQPGNILLTTGSKELHKYCKSEALKNRLMVRVLPGRESLSICQEQGLKPNQILALQGPFSTEMNLAFIHQYGISCMVSKCGGRNGGFSQKVKACEKAEIPLFVIQKEEQTIPPNQKVDPFDFAKTVQRLEEILGISLNLFTQAKLHIVLAGIGMGGNSGMTVEVMQAIKKADLLAGASRIIAPFDARLEKKAVYLPEEVLTWLQEKSVCYAEYDELCVVILFSGDTGFYSGCEKVKNTLKQAIAEQKIKGELTIYPGISSLQAMAAACKVSWQEIGIYSIHGRTNQKGWEKELLRQINQQETLFLLVSGAKDIRMLGKILQQKKLQPKIYLGYQLSYPQEEIRCLTSEECMRVEKEGLYAVIIQHNGVESGNQLTHGLADRSFIRGKVPMTKEEIREVIICKLHLYKNAVFYDIGSGTGSIAVEAAGVDASVTVYAIEQKREAVVLLRENQKKFGCTNLEIVEGTAPEILGDLETPTHAFIGGSGGQLIEILTELYAKNKRMRIVLTAITLETLAKLEKIPKQFHTRNFELIQMQVSRYEKLGAYHLLRSENPIMICSFDFEE